MHLCDYTGQLLFFRGRYKKEIIILILWLVLFCQPLFECHANPVHMLAEMTLNIVIACALHLVSTQIISTLGLCTLRNTWIAVAACLQR